MKRIVTIVVCFILAVCPVLAMKGTSISLSSIHNTPSDMLAVMFGLFPRVDEPTITYFSIYPELFQIVVIEKDRFHDRIGFFVISGGVDTSPY